MPIGFYRDVMIGEFIMAKKELTVPPIRKNPRNGRVSEHDASVVVGNSKPDVIVTPEGNDKASEVQPKGIRSVAKKKPKRSQRIYFVPNKITKAIIEEWKEKYGFRFHLSMINSAIEKYEP